MIFPTGGDDTHNLAVGDFNGDGKPDVATWNGNSTRLSISVFINDRP